MTRTCPYCGRELTFSKEEFKPEKFVCPHCGRKPYALARKRLTLARFFSAVIAIALGILFIRLTEGWDALNRWLCGTIIASAIARGTNALVRWVTSDEIFNGWWIGKMTS